MTISLRRIMVAGSFIGLFLVGVFSQRLYPSQEHDSDKAQGSADERVKRVYGRLADEPWQASQQKGDVAVGVIVYEKDGKLYLDGQPCNKKFFYFSKPYEKTLTNAKVTCQGEQIPEYRIRQK